MAKLPTEVQKKLDEANKVADELFNKGETPIQDELLVDRNTPIEGTPIKELPPVEPAPNVVDEGQGEPAPVDNIVEDNTYKHKYDVLTGKYNSEIKKANEKIEHLQSLMAKLIDERKPVEPPTSAVDSVTIPVVNGDVTEEDLKNLEEFERLYPGLSESLVKLAKKELSNTSMKEVSDKVIKVEKSLEESKTNNFYKELVDSVPDCYTINEDPLFIDWLKGTLPYVDITKYQVLQDAYERRDSAKAAQIFLDYKESIATPTTPVEPSVKNVTKFVSPPRVSRGGNVGATPTKTTYRKEEIELFYRNLSQRKLNLTKEQILAQEKEYFLAAQENRII